MAEITDGFSFAYLKEAFVATLLELARKVDGDDDEETSGDDEEDDPLDKYEFWREFKTTVRSLRDDMGSEPGDGDEPKHPGGRTRAYNEGFSDGYEKVLPLLENMRLQGNPPHQQSVKAVLPSREAAPSTRLAHDSLSTGPSPFHSFAPLAMNKGATFSDGIWEWGL
jgi:transitional endoplasmic reticulum ATPase